MAYVIVAAVIAAFILLVAKVRRDKPSGGAGPGVDDAPSRPRDLGKE